MAEEPKALSGDVPPLDLVFEDDEVIDFLEHQWGAGDVWNTPSTHYGTTRRTCRVCKVMELKPGDPSAPFGTVARLWRYENDAGIRIDSNIEISCPGPGKTLTSEALERTRQAKVEQRHTNARVHQVERNQHALAAAMEARITQLEAENRALREQVGTVTQIDLTTLAQKLLELAEEAKGRKALEAVRTEDGEYQVPKELVDVIDVVGIPVESEDEDPDDQ